jgi:FSR family fosmidomycin resistance protein-like MFS transporter
MPDLSSNPDDAAPSSTVEQRGFINQWGGKLAFFFTYMHLSHDLTTGILAALLPFIRQDLGIDYLRSGFLVSAFSLTAGLSQILGGWLSDRISRPKAIALGLGGVGLTTAAINFAPSYSALLILLVALGLFSGFYHPSAISALTTHFGEERRGRVIALHMFGGSLGFGIGPFLGGIIASHYSWHMAYLILGLPALLAAPLVLTQLRKAGVNPPKAAPDAMVAENKKIGLRHVFMSVASLFLLSAMMQLFHGPVMSFIPLFLVDVHHLSAATSSVWVTVIRLGGLVGSLAGGWLSDKWGRRNALLLTLVVYGPIVFLLARLPFGIALSAVLIMFGLLMSMRETTMQTILMDNSPPRLRATVIGIYFSFGQQGSSLIQPLAGSYMDNVGIAYAYQVISYIFSGLSTIALIVVFRGLRKRRNAAKSSLSG